MLRIGQLDVGTKRTFIIAEAGINHNGDLNTAKKLIKAAYDAGADAVKFQSFRAEIMCDMNLKETKEVAAITGGSQSSFEMYKALELDKKAHEILFEYANQLGILCFSSVFDFEAVELLKSLKAPAIKISSGDLTFYPLIEKAANTGLPLLISTGMGTQSEVVKVYELLKQMNSNFVIMHCISEYPVLAENANLNVIPAMKKLFKCPVGFSDHSSGITLSVAAVALGADVIEKHFTISNNMDGPDHKLSLDPECFKKMVEAIRDTEKSLGDNFKTPTEKEWGGRTDGRRGIKFLRSLKKDEVVTEEVLKITKPEKGLKPEFLKDVIGRKVRHDVIAGTPVDFTLLQ